VKWFGCIEERRCKSEPHDTEKEALRDTYRQMKSECKIDPTRWR